MKKQNGNMYPGVKTWNPLGGTCEHFCKYCSTKALKKRYEAVNTKYSGPLQLYPSYPPCTNKTVFVVAQNDLFAKNVPEVWIADILRRCKAKDNTYLFQTKNPARMKDFATLFPEKTILCTTIETNRDYKLSDAPNVYDRAMAMNEHYLAGFETRVTIEPICDFDLDSMRYLIRLCMPDKAHIGADSKGNHLPEPSKEKVLALIEELQKFTVIDKKTNLQRLLK